MLDHVGNLYDDYDIVLEEPMLKSLAMQRKTSQVHCRSAAPLDAPYVAAMFRELQEFHHQPVQEIDTILRQTTERPTDFEIMLAEVDGSICGFALVSTYPGPGIAPGFYLKELFVKADARKLGVGKFLMRYLAQTAIKRGYSRVDWVTTKDNQAARSFYDRLGAVVSAEKIFYRLDGTALEQLSRPSLEPSSE